jgi:hypothetical protein
VPHRFLVLLTLAFAALLSLGIVCDREPQPPDHESPAARSPAVPSAAPLAALAPAPHRAARNAPRFESEPAAGAVHGRVVDADGRPVGSARVVLLRPDGSELAATDSAPDGTFAVTVDPAAMALTLVAFCQGWAATVVDRAVAPGARATDFGDVALGVGGTIEGTVADDTGLPNTAALLQLVAVGGPLRRLPSELASTLAPEGRVQADGAFAMTGLPPGAYVVEATAPCRACCRSTLIAVTAAKTVSVGPLVLHQGLSLGGVVVDADLLPIAGCSVEAIAADGDRSLHCAKTDAGGGFQFDHLAAGGHHLRFRSGRAPELVLRDIVVGQAGPLVVRLPAGTDLVGRVLQADGEPVARFDVCLRPWSEETAAAARAERSQLQLLADAAQPDDLAAAMQRLAGLATARRRCERERFPFGIGEPVRATGRDGIFTIAAPPPGGYLLEVAVPGRPGVYGEPLSLPRGAGAGAVEVRLPRP